MTLALVWLLGALPHACTTSPGHAGVVVDGFLSEKDPRTFAARDNALEFRPDEIFQRIFADF